MSGLSVAPALSLFGLMNSAESLGDRDCPVLHVDPLCEKHRATWDESVEGLEAPVCSLFGRCRPLKAVWNSYQ
jgi:hypothetical protein